VWVTVSRDAFPNLSKTTPQRCTLVFTARTDLPGNFDPTPDNNTVMVELNVFDRGNAAANQALSVQTLVPPFAVDSRRPVAIRIRRGRSAVTKTLRLMVRSDGSGAAQGTAREITITATGGDCAPGTVGLADFDRITPGAQNVVTLRDGQTARGEVVLTMTDAAFTAANDKSPARCTAVVTATAPGTDAGAASHTTRIVIDVSDGNDF